MNPLFLTAITGECALLQLTNLKPRGYNPFVLLCSELKKEGIDLNPKNRKACFVQLEHIYRENNKAVHPLLPKAIDSINAKTTKK